MICPVDANGYCTRHRTHHRGPSLQIALDPSENAEAHRKVWDRAAERTASTPVNSSVQARLAALRCPHLGQATGEIRPCQQCGLKNVPTKVMACAVHGKCTEERLVKGEDGKYMPCCRICTDNPKRADKAVPAIAKPASGGKTALITLNIGNVLHPKSRESMQAAAQRWGAEFVEITRPVQNVGGRPHWQKVFLEGLASERGYARCVYYDADILIREDCPNVIDLTPAGHVGVVVNDQIDGVLWQAGTKNRYHSSMAEWARRLNMAVPPLHHHVNSGMIVFEPATHAGLFDAWRDAGKSCNWGAPTRLIDQASFSVLVHNLFADDNRTFLPMMFNTLIYRHELMNPAGQMQTFVYHYTGHRKDVLPRTEWRLRGRGITPATPDVAAATPKVAPLLPQPVPSQPRPSRTLLGPDVDLSTLAERAVCINLDRREDRWEQFQADLPDPWPLPTVERFRAIDVEKCPPPRWFKHAPGQWGCRQSHLRVLEDALNDGVQSLLVFEDDAVFCPDFVAKLRDFLANVPDDWQIIFLGGTHTRGERKAVNAHVESPGYVTLAHAYLLRNDALRTVYRHASQHTPERAEFDHRLGDYASTKSATVYAPRTWLVWQRAGFSDLTRSDRPLRGVRG